MKFMTSKPKLFWLAMAICCLSLVIAVPGVLLVNATGNRLIHRFLFYLLVLLWGMAALALIAYFMRQIFGSYRKIERKAIQEQIW